ncbi:hypothetical protein M2105_005140, partial [Paenibacillus sp. PastF-1]|nr:hypothetical protein [Paenibacillus sp. PastM-2]MDF9857260.1 hypothetical protein [Paenibacillus sp. PastF-1]MDH6482632.1 hypothetical protein [Paenibacillus sp. PastH-2]
MKQFVRHQAPAPSPASAAPDIADISASTLL